MKKNSIKKSLKISRIDEVSGRFIVDAQGYADNVKIVATVIGAGLSQQVTATISKATAHARLGKAFPASYSITVKPLR